MIKYIIYLILITQSTFAVDNLIKNDENVEYVLIQREIKKEFQGGSSTLAKSIQSDPNRFFPDYGFSRNNGNISIEILDPSDTNFYYAIGKNNKYYWKYQPGHVITTPEGEEKKSQAILTLIPVRENISDPRGKQALEGILNIMNDVAIKVALNHGICIERKTVKWVGDHFHGFATDSGIITIDGSVTLNDDGVPLESNYLTLRAGSKGYSTKVKYLEYNTKKPLLSKFLVEREGLNTPIFAEEEIYTLTAPSGKKMILDPYVHFSMTDDDIIVKYKGDGRDIMSNKESHYESSQNNQMNGAKIMIISISVLLATFILGKKTINNKTIKKKEA